MKFLLLAGVTLGSLLVSASLPPPRDIKFLPEWSPEPPSDVLVMKQCHWDHPRLKKRVGDCELSSGTTSPTTTSTSTSQSKSEECYSSAWKGIAIGALAAATALLAVQVAICCGWIPWRRFSRIERKPDEEASVLWSARPQEAGTESR